MYVIVGEIVVCLKSGFELEAPYMVFIVRKWPGGTTICDQSESRVLILVIYLNLGVGFEPEGYILGNAKEGRWVVVGLLKTRPRYVDLGFNFKKFFPVVLLGCL